MLTVRDAGDTDAGTTSTADKFEEIVKATADTDKTVKDLRIDFALAKTILGQVAQHVDRPLMKTNKFIEESACESAQVKGSVNKINTELAKGVRESGQIVNAAGVKVGTLVDQGTDKKVSELGEAVRKTGQLWNYNLDLIITIAVVLMVYAVPNGAAVAEWITSIIRQGGAYDAHCSGKDPRWCERRGFTKIKGVLYSIAYIVMGGWGWKRQYS